VRLPIKGYLLFRRFSTRMSTTPVYRSTASFARKHPRVSVIAAGAAAAGMITAATATAGVAAIGQAGTSQTPGHSAAMAFDADSGLTRPVTTGGSASPLAPAHAHATAAHPAAKPAIVDAKVKHVAARPKPAAKPKPVPQPYSLYDSVTPSSLPSGAPAAVYANGAYASSASQVAGHKSVLWIDTNGSDPKANVLDVEPGDATPYGAAQWVHAKLSADPASTAIVYTMMSDWQQVKDGVHALPVSMQRHVQYWIADPTGTPHIVPGSNATQWYWGSSIDKSMANGNFNK
jgi:hypothetical protein